MKKIVVLAVSGLLFVSNVFAGDGAIEPKTLETQAAKQVATAEVTQVNVTIGNVKKSAGSIYISVYDSKDTFLSEDRVKHIEVPVAENLEEGKISSGFTLPYGEYAITVYHDANNNDEMDSNFIGIPKEPVAMSNNHIPRFGPPKYAKAMIVLGTAEHQENMVLNK